MVVKKEVISSGNNNNSEEYYTPLPQKLLVELESLTLHYPGWQKDYNSAREYFRLGSPTKFGRAFRKLEDKQRVYDDYKAFTRLNALASLELTYPGHELDKQAVEEWHLKHPSNDETDSIFQDKLEGLRNKEQLYFGDRTHPNIRDLDSLDLTYPGWEDDYQAAVAAHCDTPAKSFANMLHRLRESEKMHQGDRSHWRLIQLGSLKLSYPGWEKDVAQVEAWHLRNSDSPKNNALYAEVIEGMKDQQQIYLGWDHNDEEVEEEISTNATSIALDSHTDATLDRQKNEEEMQLAQCYESIAESLNSIEGQRKKLQDERSSMSSSLSSKQGDSSSSVPHTSKNVRSLSPTERTSTGSRGLQAKVLRSSTASFGKGPAGPPPKQINLGKCEVCFARPKTHVFVPCGHLCACAACSVMAMEEAGTCPICRRQADNSYRVFLT